MSLFAEKGGRVLVSVCAVGVVVVAGIIFSMLFSAKQSGREAEALSEFMTVQRTALQYFNDTGSFEGFCNSEILASLTENVEAIKPVGVFSDGVRTLECSSTDTQYAVSMSRAVGRSDKTHVCTSESTEHFVSRTGHVSGPTCE